MNWREKVVVMMIKSGMINERMMVFLPKMSVVVFEWLGMSTGFNR